MFIRFPTMPIKFIHTADLHIDSPMEGLDTYDGAPVEALRSATRRAFRNLVDLAIEEKVDFVLIAGDIYDGDWKDFSTGLFFTGEMARLRSAAVPVYLIAGNHDAVSVITKKLQLPDNVHTFSTRTTESKEVEGLPVVIHGRGFPQRAVTENLVPDYPVSAKGKFNIGMLHTSLTGIEGHDTYAPCSISDLRDKGYAYWALGHIHKPSAYFDEPWIGFSGNLQGRHVRETGPRGCRLVTVSDSLEIAANEFKELDVVRWERVTVDLSGSSSEQDAFARIGAALASNLAEVENRLLATRLVLEGATLLHDRLKHEVDWLKAECIAQAQLVGTDSVWIEKIEVRTSPIYDLKELAERDDLTRIVLEELNKAEAGAIQIPEGVQQMLSKLPVALRSEVEDLLKAEQQPALVDDIRSIILHALSTSPRP